jgi:hypothetical protein
MFNIVCPTAGLDDYKAKLVGSINQLLLLRPPFWVGLKIGFTHNMAYNDKPSFFGVSYLKIDPMAKRNRFLCENNDSLISFKLKTWNMYSS